MDWRRTKTLKQEKDYETQRESSHRLVVPHLVVGCGGWTMKSTEQKRREGETRNAEYRKLSTREKIKRLDAGGYVAKKQRAKLVKQLLENPNNV